MNTEAIRLTQYSHGAGCGCKIAPDILSRILASTDTEGTQTDFSSLLVGHHTRDDAAAVILNEEYALLSTTDFFMPIVDDPYDFGRIAATNAISDIYAMGGSPLVAVAILGWPISKLSAETAGQVVKGGRDVCQRLGFPLAGGHSIDCPEPIFGLAVTGTVLRKRLKRNDGGQVGDQLILTKPLGIGIHTTAGKQGKLSPEHTGIATAVMCQANDVGALLAQVEGVNALTDVTGFGLAGHLLEMCDGANLDAIIDMPAVPELPGLDDYIRLGCVPGGTARNIGASGKRLPALSKREESILYDPQTSGGLLVSVTEQALPTVKRLLIENGLPSSIIGVLSEAGGPTPQILLSST
ncbi:MAG: selenide, water dikinase SelD [Luminiphilus sp.]|jgi:selenide,water dikinase|nr:selenide, water dikinase SelD [Luminiphilus sp.]